MLTTGATGSGNDQTRRTHGNARYRSGACPGSGEPAVRGRCPRCNQIVNLSPKSQLAIRHTAPAWLRERLAAGGGS